MPDAPCGSRLTMEDAAREVGVGKPRSKDLHRGSAREGDVPPRYPFFRVARFAVREGSLLIVSLPVAAIGIVAWIIPYRGPRLIVRFAKPESQGVATFKLVGAIVAFGLWYVAALLLAGWWLGPSAALMSAILLPVLGFIAFYWTGRFDRDREEVLLFLRVLRRGWQDRLAAYRHSLVSEFDRVLEDQSRDRPLRST